MPAEETDEQQITKLHEGITKFFREEHMEANKRVKSHELITMRPEVLVRDQHHKVKLIELPSPFVMPMVKLYTKAKQVLRQVFNALLGMDEIKMAAPYQQVATQ